MTKFLRDQLDAEEPMFTMALKQLENASGNTATDVKLTSEILEKAHDRMRKLGLDVKDTDGRELYNALKNLIGEHDKHLAKQMGGSADDEPTKLIPLIKAAADNSKVDRGCWVLKKSVAETFLRETPPPNIMKQMGYDNVDDMLKKENLLEIYGALRFAEDGEWLNAFNEHYDRLTADDFTAREIEIVVMPHERWADICESFVKKKKHNITHLKEMGVVLMLPIKQDHLPGLSIWAGSLLFHYINEIRLYSTFFKMQRHKADFGKIFVDTLIADPDMGPIMAGQNIHWRVIQRYFGKFKNEHHPEIFQPHVQPEDLHWRKAEEALYGIDPELKFWEDLDYVSLMFEDRPLTFNMMDVAASYTNNTPYEEREIYHFREALWNEIFMRYMGEGTLEDQILKQLDNDMIEPENLSGSD